MSGLTPLRVLMGWRRYVRIVYEAVESIVPEAEAYVAGGVAEGRLATRSGIDVVIALPHKPRFGEAVELRSRIIEEAGKLGLPLYAPIGLHIVGREELEKYVKRSRVLRVADLL
jgi:hypothetical protein